MCWCPLCGGTRKAGKDLCECSPVMALHHSSAVAALCSLRSGWIPAADTGLHCSKLCEWAHSNKDTDLCAVRCVNISVCQVCTGFHYHSVWAFLLDRCAPNTPIPVVSHTWWGVGYLQRGLGDCCCQTLYHNHKLVVCDRLRSGISCTYWELESQTAVKLQEVWIIYICTCVQCAHQPAPSGVPLLPLCALLYPTCCCSGGCGRCLPVPLSLSLFPCPCGQRSRQEVGSTILLCRWWRGKRTVQMHFLCCHHIPLWTMNLNLSFSALSALAEK